MDQRLIEVVARGFAARDELMAIGNDEPVRLAPNKLQHLQGLARLSYLDPALVRSILEGTQPRSLTARSLWRQRWLPVSWPQQSQELLGLQPR